MESRAETKLDSVLGSPAQSRQDHNRRKEYSSMMVLVSITFLYITMACLLIFLIYFVRKNIKVKT